MRSEGYSTWFVRIYVRLCPVRTVLTLGAHAQRGLVCQSVVVRLLPRFLPPRGKIATPTGSALHWLDFIDFRKSTALRSYGVKTK